MPSRETRTDQTQRESSDRVNALGWYVYRLIDPRNGFTFYVGKGRDDRVFHHAEGALRDVDEAEGDAAAATLKLDTIRAIVREGLAVHYVIHRHGLDTAEAAYEVEAALIDAYPGLANLARGHGADRGCRSVDQIVALYGAAPLEIFEPTILIYVGKSYDYRGGPYDAVRGVWRMSHKNAEKHRLVLAYDAPSSSALTARTGGFPPPGTVFPSWRRTPYIA